LWDELEAGHDVIITRRTYIRDLPIRVEKLR
jgi:hypothetical protein